jgi:hypothetical protein
VQKQLQKENGLKDAILFHQHLPKNFTAYFRLQLLRLMPYFGTILPNGVAMKSIKIICAKAALLWH